jgi:hypothetical protein
MHRRGVTEGVRADALGPKGWDLAAGLSCVAFHQGVNAKASQSLSPMIEEERFPAGALTDQLFECGGSPGPKRTAARFSDFVISAENDLAHLGCLSGQFVDQSRTGFRVAESGLG